MKKPLPLAPVRQQIELKTLLSLAKPWLIVNSLALRAMLPMGGTAGSSSRARIQTRTGEPLLMELQGCVEEPASAPAQQVAANEVLADATEPD